MKFPLNRKTAGPSIFGAASARSHAARKLKSLCRDHNELKLIILDDSGKSETTVDLPSSLTKLETLLLRPNIVVTQRSERLFSFIGLVEFLKAEIINPVFDDEKVGGCSTFEEAKDLYQAHILDPRDSSNLRKSLKASAAVGVDSLSPREFLYSARERMIELDPMGSLLYALDDPIIKHKLSSSLIFGNWDWERQGIDTSLTFCPPGLFWLFAKPSHYNQKILSVTTFEPALQELAAGTNSSGFYALDASKMPSRVMNVLGPSFIPTDDFASSAKLMLMVADKTFSDLIDSNPKMHEKEARIKAMDAARKSHAALNA